MANGEQRSGSRQDHITNLAKRASAPASSLPPKTEITAITSHPKKREDRSSPLRAMVEAAMSRTQNTDELLASTHPKRDRDGLASSRAPDNRVEMRK